MHLTRKSDYALRGLAFLASRPQGVAVSLAEIAETQGLPSSFLAKVFHKLNRDGVVTAVRGPGGGYTLARPPSSTTILQIIESVEGPRLHDRCLLWDRTCGEARACALHDHVKMFVPELVRVLAEISLAKYVDESASLEHAASTTTAATI
jgi:Rrf2 family iron-sulfur cluster assembly transcriptional regulator